MLSAILLVSVVSELTIIRDESRSSNGASMAGITPDPIDYFRHFLKQQEEPRVKTIEF